MKFGKHVQKHLNLEAHCGQKMLRKNRAHWLRNNGKLYFPDEQRFVIIIVGFFLFVINQDGQRYETYV